MEIQSFEELSDRVWATIKKPIVAIYRLERMFVSQPGYIVKIFDGETDTGIYMHAYRENEIREDIEKHAGWLERFERGAGDVPELVGIYA